MLGGIRLFSMCTSTAVVGPFCVLAHERVRRVLASAIVVFASLCMSQSLGCFSRAILLLLLILPLLPRPFMRSVPLPWDFIPGLLVPAVGSRHIAGRANPCKTYSRNRNDDTTPVPGQCRRGWWNPEPQLDRRGGCHASGAAQQRAASGPDPGRNGLFGPAPCARTHATRTQGIDAQPRPAPGGGQENGSWVGVRAGFQGRGSDPGGPLPADCL